MFGRGVFCPFPGFRAPARPQMFPLGEVSTSISTCSVPTPGRPCKPMFTCILLGISNCGAKLQALGSFWIHAGVSCCYLPLATSRFSDWLQRSHPLHPSCSHSRCWQILPLSSLTVGKLGGTLSVSIQCLILDFPFKWPQTSSTSLFCQCTGGSGKAG